MGDSSAPTEAELRRAWKRVEEAKAADPMAFDEGREHHSARSTAQYVHDRVEEEGDHHADQRKTVITGPAADRLAKPSFVPTQQASQQQEFQALDATQLGYVTKKTGLDTPVEVSSVPGKAPAAPRIIGKGK